MGRLQIGLMMSSKVLLVAKALLADFVFTVVRVAPIGLPLLISSLIFQGTYVPYLAAIVTLFMAWLMRPEVDLPNRRMLGEDSPLLAADVDELKASLSVSESIEIDLDGSMNASARQSRGFFGLVGTKSILTLGVPLLLALNRDQVRAVIAHGSR